MRNIKGQFIKGTKPKNGFKKGVQPFNAGKKASEITRLKISLSIKDKWQNPEYRKMMSDKHKGKVLEKSSNWQGGKISKVCTQCGTTFEVFSCRENAKFCSISCSAKQFVGSKARNWRGGISIINKLGRTTEGYNDWRKSVYKRDCWTCQHCNKKQKHPVAHHIMSFKDYPELRLEVSNGITLCRSCHKKVHKEIGASTRFGRVFDGTNGLLALTKA